MSLFTQQFNFDFKGLTLKVDSLKDQVYQVFPHGRKTFKLPKWFDKGKGVTYITCSAIKFDHIAGEDRYLVWPYSTDAKVKGYWDGSKLHLTELKGVKSLALFCSDRVTLLRTYTPRPYPGQEPAERIFNINCTPIDDPPDGPIDEPIDVCLMINQLPVLGIEPGVRPELPCVFGEALAIETLATLP